MASVDRATSFITKALKELNRVRDLCNESIARAEDKMDKAKSEIIVNENEKARADRIIERLQELVA